MHSPLDQLANFAKKLGIKVTAVYAHDWSTDEDQFDGYIELDEELTIEPMLYGVVSRDYLEINGKNFHPHPDYKVNEEAFKLTMNELLFRRNNNAL
ncbi:hypothetical protein [Vibrio coralliilyticus]|uniref:hypothetical protein n=1 Tax=Vibrio coralliilyticus TaxID=190893 RepID=UPI000BAACEDA|nr:hypothetical protein [Vibrio coralliilyticus]NOI57796.1 hypothetical protein [Vibrio coralliilyticus]PAT69738.1 hypothetical protein CKA27_02965 [Vibrio coralliilyticus]